MKNRRYWSIRTDKDNRKVLYNELTQGKLRQGWGYDENQSLTIIQNVINRG